MLGYGLQLLKEYGIPLTSLYHLRVATPEPFIGVTQMLKSLPDGVGQQFHVTSAEARNACHSPILR